MNALLELETRAEALRLDIIRLGDQILRNPDPMFTTMRTSTRKLKQAQLATIEARIHNLCNEDIKS